VEAGNLVGNTRGTPLRGVGRRGKPLPTREVRPPASRPPPKLLEPSTGSEVQKPPKGGAPPGDTQEATSASSPTAPVNTHFLLPFCPCGYHDVFPYPVVLHKMNCFAGENFIVDRDWYPRFLNTIRPVLKKAIILVGPDVGFTRLLFEARQRSPMIRSLPTSSPVTTDDEQPPERQKTPPPPGPTLATVEERLLRLQEEFTQLAPDLLSTTTELYRLKDSVGSLKRRLRARQARHRSQSLRK